jgi:hypothetical protein
MAHRLTPPDVPVYSEKTRKPENKRIILELIWLSDLLHVDWLGFFFSQLATETHQQSSDAFLKGYRRHRVACILLSIVSQPFWWQLVDFRLLSLSLSPGRLTPRMWIGWDPSQLATEETSDTQRTFFFFLKGYWQCHGVINILSSIV